MQMTCATVLSPDPISFISLFNAGLAYPRESR
jgi:hypothetical protein